MKIHLFKPKMNHIELDSHIRKHWFTEKLMIIYYDTNIGLGVLKYKFGWAFTFWLWRYRLTII